MAEVGTAHAARHAASSPASIRAPDGAPFVNQLFLAAHRRRRSAATPTAGSRSLGIGNGGHRCCHDSVEIDELKYPIVIREQRIVPDSEGAGRFRGAPGRVRRVRPGRLLDRGHLPERRHAHRAARRARRARGRLARSQRKRCRDGTLSPELGCYARVVLEAGRDDRLAASGGGGYGPPRERDPERVAKDALEGWITRGRARRSTAWR